MWMAQYMPSSIRVSRPSILVRLMKGLKDRFLAEEKVRLSFDHSSSVRRGEFVIVNSGPRLDFG